MKIMVHTQTGILLGLGCNHVQQLLCYQLHHYSNNRANFAESSVLSASIDKLFPSLSTSNAAFCEETKEVISEASPATNKQPEKRGTITSFACPFHFTNIACIGQNVVYPAAFKRCINLCSDLGAVCNACQHTLLLFVIISFAFSIPLINLSQIRSNLHYLHPPKIQNLSKSLFY